MIDISKKERIIAVLCLPNDQIITGRVTEVKGSFGTTLIEFVMNGTRYWTHPKNVVFMKDEEVKK